MEREQTVERFRQRLGELMASTGLTRAAFARRVGIDRSTLSQILSASSDRLPRVETLAAIANAENVSLDWLVGLTDKGPMAAAVLELEPGAGSPSDERLSRWRRESAGYKIRHVPTTLPDLVRTDAVIEHEYRHSITATPEQRRETREARLDYERRSETDTEVCSPFQELEMLANGQGVWSSLRKRARREQLAHIAELVDELYPTFRWFLYDGLIRYSVPLTIFGQHRAVIYTGQMYLVFNGAEHVRVLMHQFDGLIRAAVVQPPAVVDYVQELLKAA